MSPRCRVSAVHPHVTHHPRLWDVIGMPAARPTSQAHSGSGPGDGQTPPSGDPLDGPRSAGRAHERRVVPVRGDERQGFRRPVFLDASSAQNCCLASWISKIAPSRGSLKASALERRVILTVLLRNYKENHRLQICASGGLTTSRPARSLAPPSSGIDALDGRGARRVADLHAA